MKFETFSSLKSDDEVVEFFKKHFPDALALVGEYVFVTSMIYICWAISYKTTQILHVFMIFFKEKPSVFFSYLVSSSNGYNKGKIYIQWLQ